VQYLGTLTVTIYKEYSRIKRQDCYRLGKSRKVREIEIDHGKPGNIRRKCKRDWNF